MRLTVKTSSSKLRQATRTSASGRSVSGGSRDQFVGGDIIEGKRARNVKKSYVIEEDSDDDEDEDMLDVGDEDAEGESEEEEEEDAEDDGLGDEDAEGDIDMDVPPPPPVIKISKAAGKQTITAKPPAKVDTKTVEQKEVELGSDDDEELSELDSDLGEEVEEEEGMQTGNEEDADGDEEEIEVEVDDDDEMESDDETPMDGSRATTPDLNKLTKRQRARREEGGSGHLLALPDGK
jgi:Ino eighty subunit 2